MQMPMCKRASHAHVIVDATKVPRQQVCWPSLTCPTMTRAPHACHLIPEPPQAPITAKGMPRTCLAQPTCFRLVPVCMSFHAVQPQFPEDKARASCTSSATGDTSHRTLAATTSLATLPQPRALLPHPHPHRPRPLPAQQLQVRRKERRRSLCTLRPALPVLVRVHESGR